MWAAQNEPVEHDRVRKVTLFRNGHQATYRQVIDAWQRDHAFRSFFIEHLRGAPFEAYRWETPAVTAANVDQAFAFVLVNDRALAGLAADPSAFADKFGPHPTEHAMTFPNLGGDALLVVPTPMTTASAYAHLAAFTRHAPEAQQHALWQAVGAALDQQLGAKPVWVSTAGLGVPWLHVRLDARPKYYSYEPYRKG